MGHHDQSLWVHDENFVMILTALGRKGKRHPLFMPTKTEIVLAFRLQVSTLIVLVKFFTSS
jgi:hypothetical protein